MYRLIKRNVSILLGVLVGVLVSMALARGTLMITNITTAKWFFPAFDAGLMLVFSSAVTLYCINRISKKFPDTNELLPFFGLIVWVLLIVGYYVVRYNNNYQTSLSIIVAGSIAGMGWWIQFITS